MQTPRKDIYNFVGTILKDRYEVLDFIEEGGMGVVYRAVDRVTTKDVAVKILPPRYLITEEKAAPYLKLFQREIEILQKLDHPNIVSIIDSGVENETLFIIMEWLDGVTLGRHLLNVGALPTRQVAAIISQICEGLSVAHQRKIIHLDLKPNNIFLLNVGTSNEKIKIIDFGLSRIIQSTLGSTLSRVVGTPQYMAPEVFENRASHLSDIYSLGILSYEMLTGLLPFNNSQIYALLRDQLQQAAPSVRKAKSDVPELSDLVIQRALNKTPKLRPQNVREFSEEFLRGILSFEDTPVQTSLPGDNIYMDKPYLGYRRRLLSGHLVVFALCAVIGSLCFANRMYKFAFVSEMSTFIVYLAVTLFAITLYIVNFRKYKYLDRQLDAFGLITTMIMAFLLIDFLLNFILYYYGY
jgi:serine/threonine protein kinase